MNEKLSRASGLSVVSILDTGRNCFDLAGKPRALHFRTSQRTNWATLGWLDRMANLARLEIPAQKYRSARLPATTNARKDV